ncbi:uncharacterized protein LOC144168882 isoform X1 [Haemaphysalis longicornis]
MELDKLVTLGTQLGLRDSELREWVRAEQDRMRAERAAEREANKAAAELEHANLQLKLRLQEGARNNPQGNEASASAAAPAPMSISPHNFIPPFDDRRDDLDAYLMRFERIALAQQWPEDKWAVGLSMCLTGDALTVIGRMTPEDSLNYQKVKLALLQRFRFTAQGYNDKFRYAMAEDGETGAQFASRLSGYFDRWIETSGVPKTFESLRDKMIAEQFLKCCSQELVVFIKERDFQTINQMAEVSDRFLEAQSLKNLGKFKEDTPTHAGSSHTDGAAKKGPTCFICGRVGHRAPDCRMAGQAPICSDCGKPGHQ